MVIIWSSPMDFMFAAALGGILSPLASAKFISKRDLPESKAILPGMVIVSSDFGLIWDSSVAVNAELSPNNFFIAPSKLGPPGVRPNCAKAGASPRQRIIVVRMGRFFFMLNGLLMKDEWMKSSVESRK